MPTWRAQKAKDPFELCRAVVGLMGDATWPDDEAARHTGFELDELIRHLCALVVASVAAYASYVHQREFALQGGADAVSAALWPLSVDGLLLFLRRWGC